MKVGEYFRTPYGDIGKITGIPKHDKYQDDGFYLDDEFIICGRKAMKELKSTPNIIDLIEVGDYVNGHRVEEIDFDDEVLYTESEYHCGSIDFDMISKIVTKEQFESMEYKVKE